MTNNVTVYVGTAKEVLTVKQAKNLLAFLSAAIEKAEEKEKEWPEAECYKIGPDGKYGYMARLPLVNSTGEPLYIARSTREQALSDAASLTSGLPREYWRSTYRTARPVCLVEELGEEFSL